MSKKKVLGYLEHLEKEIDRLQECDGPTKEHLTRLTSDIKHLLEGPEDDSRRVALVQQLKMRMEQFETEHPGLTRVLDQIMTSLSSMGV
jgi:hypothetical protein